ncbi:MAG TPA: hypothetical protein PLI53_08365, partial [Geobacteraceae bacterium]|nr:hypothetical protein [Geobacteraceae bacterium]
MKRAVVFLMILVLLPVAGLAEKGYLEVTASPDRKAYLALASTVSQGGGESDDISRNVMDALRFDMDLTGRFTM